LAKDNEYKHSKVNVTEHTNATKQAHAATTWPRQTVHNKQKDPNGQHKGQNCNYNTAKQKPNPRPERLAGTRGRSTSNTQLPEPSKLPNQRISISTHQHSTPHTHFVIGTAG
jgi:hypothetical protein